MDVGLVLARKHVRDSVSSCTECSLYAGCTSPVPFSGPAPNQIAVVGEAPGKDEDRLGEPFVGVSGKYAREKMAEVGIEPSQLAWLNIVSCYPNRTPTPDEVRACRVNLDRQLDFIQPKYLLIFGGVAISSFWDGLRMGEMRGLWWATDNTHRVWAMATWHPAAVLRNRKLEGEFVRDLIVFKNVAIGGAVAPWSDLCVKCGELATAECDRLLPWCEKHFPPNVEKRAKELAVKSRKRQGKKSGVVQGSLL